MTQNRQIQSFVFNKILHVVTRKFSIIYQNRGLARGSTCKRENFLNAETKCGGRMNVQNSSTQSRHYSWFKHQQPQHPRFLAGEKHSNLAFVHCALPKFFGWRGTLLCRLHSYTSCIVFSPKRRSCALVVPAQTYRYNIAWVNKNKRKKKLLSAARSTCYQEDSTINFLIHNSQQE